MKACPWRCVSSSYSSRRLWPTMPMRVALVLVGLLLTATIPASAATPAPIQYIRPSLDTDQLAIPSGALSDTWTSAIQQPDASFTRLVVSWNADTPGSSRVTASAQVTTRAGETSAWYTLGVW